MNRSIRDTVELLIYLFIVGITFEVVHRAMNVYMVDDSLLMMVLRMVTGILWLTGVSWIADSILLRRQLRESTKVFEDMLLDQSTTDDDTYVG